MYIDMHIFLIENYLNCCSIERKLDIVLSCLNIQDNLYCLYTFSIQYQNYGVKNVKNPLLRGPLIL